MASAGAVNFPFVDDALDLLPEGGEQGYLGEGLPRLMMGGVYGLKSTPKKSDFASSFDSDSVHSLVDVDGEDDAPGVLRKFCLIFSAGLMGLYSTPHSFDIVMSISCACT